MPKLVYWLDYFVKLLLLLTILQGIALAIVYAIKTNGKRQTNYLYAALLFSSSLTLLHQLLYYLGYANQNPRLNFLPIYFTFLLGPLLFYYVKSASYKTFILNKEDIKHFILPIAQFSFFVLTYNRPSHDLLSIKNSILFPYYGVFEKFIFAVTFLAYLYFASKFVKVNLQHEQQTYWQKRNNFRLRVLLKISYYLFLLHAILLISDPVLYKFFKIDVNNLKIITWLHYLTFAATIVWYGIWGYAQEYLTFLEGTSTKATNLQDLYNKLTQISHRDKHYQNNNLKPAMYLKLIPNTTVGEIEQCIKQHTGLSFNQWLNKLRYQILLEQTNTPSATEIYNTGFTSIGAFEKTKKS